MQTLSRPLMSSVHPRRRNVGSGIERSPASSRGGRPAVAIGVEQRQKPGHSLRRATGRRLVESLPPPSTRTARALALIDVSDTEPQSARFEAESRRLAGEITELRASQAQLVQSEKLRSLGQLTAGVAHEINNPLAFSLNNAQLAHARVTSVSRRLAASRWLASREGSVSERLAAGLAALDGLARDRSLTADVADLRGELATLSPPQQLELLQQFFTYVIRHMESTEGSIEELLARSQKVLEETFVGFDRMTKIVLGLRNFARLDEAELQTADIDEGIRHTLMLLGSSAEEKGVKLSSDLGLSRPHCCLPAKLNQVILNVVTNAIDASRRDGEVSVQTREHQGFVEITVADGGEGISEENMSKVFDPFFTTRPVGKGTGLGLSVSHQIVMEHRGSISVSRNDHAGVTFLIRIPADGAASQTTAVEST